MELLRPSSRNQGLHPIRAQLEPKDAKGTVLHFVQLRETIHEMMHLEEASLQIHQDPDKSIVNGNQVKLKSNEQQFKTSDFGLF